MTDQLSLYKGALLKLGQPRIVALTDEGTARRALDDCYAKVVKGCLEAGLWNFAMRFAEATASPSLATSFGYRYVFEKPDDWLRTAGVWEDGTQKVPLLDYADRATNWLANRETIYVGWISNHEDYGMDLGLWPETFVEYVEFKLAYTVCVDVTGSETKLDKLEKDAEKARRNASNRDAMNEPVTRFPPPGRLVTSRRSSRNTEHGR